MHNLQDIARVFGLKPIRGGFHGACPVCGYPRGFSMSEKQGTLLCYCHVGQCTWQEIQSAFQSKGLLKEKQKREDAIVAKVAIVPSRLEKIATAHSTGCYSDAFSTFHLELWTKSLPAKNTPVETYLQSRGVVIPLPGSIRYLPKAFHKPSGQYFPVMLACVDHTGHAQPVAVHRTFLKPDGSGKASVEPNKMMLGKVQGGSVHLAEPTDTLAICEGLETGLSVQQATRIPTWAGLSCAGMKTLMLPAIVNNVLIFADADKPGLKAAYDAAERYSHEGRIVKLLRPTKWGQDFNDVLMRSAAP